MAGSRAGRRHKGPRHPTMVRFPVDHYEHYARQAAELGVAMSDFVAFRMAVMEGLPIPAPVLLDNPALLALLPADQRAQVLGETPGLGSRYRAVIGTEALPIQGLAAGTSEGDVTRAA